MLEPLSVLLSLQRREGGNQQAGGRFKSLGNEMAQNFFDAGECAWIDDHRVSSHTLCSRRTTKRDRLPAP